MELNSINDIAAFVAAVRAGSYTRAAVTLGLTRSAVGKSIVRLETRLGVRLLNRTTRSLSLTDEGRIMYERCRQILEDLEEVDSTMALRRVVPTGRLKLTASQSFGQRHILPLVGEYLRQWPELQADVSFSDRYVDIVEEGFDIAIRIGDERDDSRLLSRTIGWQQVVTCASAEYLQRKGIPQRPEDLFNHDNLFLAGVMRRRDWKFKTPEGIYSFDCPGRLNIDSAEAMRESALAGFGIINMPTYLTAEDIKAGRLVPVLAAFNMEPEPIRLLYPSKQHLSPRIRGFIDLLVERWADGVPWHLPNL